MLPTGVTRGKANPLHKKFPERLRKARKAAGLSAAALCQAAEMSRSSVSQLEARQGVPRLRTVERLARALKVSVAWLAFGLGEAALPAEGEGLRCEGLAQRAKSSRINRGLSVREADRRAETSPGAVRAIEAGGQPSLDTLEALAKALEVSPAWLAFGMGPMDVPKRRRVGQQEQSTPAAG